MNALTICVCCQSTSVSQIKKEKSTKASFLVTRTLILLIIFWLYFFPWFPAEKIHKNVLKYHEHCVETQVKPLKVQSAGFSGIYM